MKATITVLLLSIYGIFASTAYAGGEDFPFFCSIGDSGETFKVFADRRSETGYAMHYYQRGKFVAHMPAVIENTTANRHTRVRAKYQKGLFDRHLIAFIGKSSQDYSSADTKVSLHGLNPAAYNFKPLRCR
jgi:hypothetical protein